MRARTFYANLKKNPTTAREQLLNVPFAFFKMLCGIGNGMPLNQDILFPEFVVRIAPFRNIAVQLRPIMEIKNLSSVAECGFNFVVSPDVECAFGGFAVARITDPFSLTSTAEVYLISQAFKVPLSISYSMAKVGPYIWLGGQWCE